MQLDRELEGYLNHLAIERGLAANTLAAYRRDLDRYGQWCRSRGLLTAGDVSENAIADFAASLRDPLVGTPLATSSAARVLVAVRGFHRFALDEGLATTDPSLRIQPPAIPRRLPTALTVDQVGALLGAAGDDETPIGLRDRALVELLYGTGARISEAVDIDVDDADLVDRTLIVTGKGSRQRLLPLGDFAIAAVQAYLVRGRPALAGRGRGTPAVFVNARGARLSRQSAYGIVRAAARRAQLDVQISPHTLRHTYATHLLQGGADVRVVQELLGHASVTTTQIYTHVTADTLREVYATSHPRAGVPGR
ncbi:MAG: site-specific tyrosine recombinase XerD [Candidatus Nanopelagicales bacterium]|nr:site-specific tyrosine recombinase XerD [Candidatus Nanopelagicales bacterium]